MKKVGLVDIAVVVKAQQIATTNDNKDRERERVSLLLFDVKWIMKKLN